MFEEEKIKVTIISVVEFDEDFQFWIFSCTNSCRFPQTQTLPEKFRSIMNPIQHVSSNSDKLIQIFFSSPK